MTVIVRFTYYLNKNSAGVDLSCNISYNTFLGSYTNVDSSSNTYNYSAALGHGAIIDTTINKLLKMYQNFKLLLYLNISKISSSHIKIF